MTQKFKKGDRVRFVYADRTLSEKAVVIYDLFATEDSPRNMSWLEGPTEQFYHTDLLVPEDFTGEVTLPQPEEWFIAVGNNHGWGRARTLDAAVQNMRRQGGKVTSYVVHKVNKYTQVNDMGSLTFPRGMGDPELVKTVKPKAKAKA